MVNTYNKTFSKYHGNGNDFIIFDLTHFALAPSLSWLLENAERLCCRHTGIGADGVIAAFIEKDRIKMTVINADGSMAKNCGNGLPAGTFDRSRKPKNVLPFCVNSGRVLTNGNRVLLAPFFLGLRRASRYG